MAYLSTCERGHLVVEARPRNESIVIKLGDALLVLDLPEAIKLGADLAAVAAEYKVESEVSA
jgi:hypothetical protein